MSKDYQDGFKDGFAKGLEEGKKIGMGLPQIGWPSTSPYLDLKEHCPKCGIKISGAMGYVCHSPGCPTFPQVTCGPGFPMTAMTTGAVGAPVVSGKPDWTPGYNEGGLDRGLGDSKWSAKGW